MTRVIGNIDAVNWQIALEGFGDVVEGIADINQQIALILRTPLGSVRLLPSFGSNIHKILDRPIQRAIPLMREEIFNALLQETRIVVQNVQVTYVPADRIEKLRIRVRYALADGVEIGQNFFASETFEMDIFV